MHHREDTYPTMLNRNAGAGDWSAQSSLKNELLAFFQMVRRQLPLMAGATFVGMALFGVYALTATPVFRATAQLSLDPRSLDIVQTAEERGRNPDAPQSDSARIDTMAEAMQSVPVVTELVRKFDLADDPEYNGTRPSLKRQVIDFISGEGAPPTEAERFQNAVAALQRNFITVARASGTYIVTVGVISTDPEKSARLTNGLANAYISTQLQDNFETTRAAAEWMKSRLTELSARQLQADKAVVEFKSANGILTSDGKLVSDQVLSDLSAKLTEASADLAEKKARLDRVDAVMRSNDLDASVSDATTNDVVIALRKEYIDADNRANELAKRYGESHQAVQKFRRDAASILEGIRGELQRIAQNYRNDYDVALQRQQSLKKDLDDQFQKNIGVSQNQVQLQALESTSQAARVAYQDMLQRYTDTVQKQNFPLATARIFGDATVPSTKYKPRASTLLPLGGALGLFVGFGFGLVRDMLDKRIRTRKEAVAATGVPCLGLFPLVATGRSHPPMTFAATGATDKTAVPWDYVMHEPFSVGSEAIRAVKVAIDFRPGGNRVIGVVSSLPGEGKSTTASMLAHMIADGGRRVLLIDADMRHPALSRRIHPAATVGLADVLTKNASFEDAVLRDPGGRIDFLNALTQIRVTQSHQLVGSREMEDLLQFAAQSYDYVILDLPPILPVIDVQTVAPYLDIFVMVIGWANTQRDIVQSALESSPLVQAKLVGTILNLVRLDKVERYGEYVKSYYSDKYHKA